MADSREVFAWPELALYVWTGNASAIMAYAESVELSVSRALTKFLYPTTGVGYAGRSQYVETNKTVAMTIGTLYAGAGLYGMLASGANISATVSLSTLADGSTSVFTLWSAQMPDFSLQGGEGAVFKQKVKIIAPDCSGL
jgi:ABC-type Na+ transport system ATPase subunit NatA